MNVSTYERILDMRHYMGNMKDESVVEEFYKVRDGVRESYPDRDTGFYITASLKIMEHRTEEMLMKYVGVEHRDAQRTIR